MYRELYKAQLDSYEKFWKRENKNRVLLDVTASKGGTPFRPAADLNEKWLSEEYNYQCYLHQVANTYFAAEGVPRLFVNLGPGCLAACVGGDYVLAPDTVWFDSNPIVTDWANPPVLHLDTESDM